MFERIAAPVTRRQVIQAGGATFAGYALSVETVLAQAIKTDTQGIVAGDHQVPIGSYNMPVFEARPATGAPAPIILVISEVWGVHESSATVPGASPRRGSTRSRPSSSSARAGWAVSRTSRTS